MSLLTLMAYLWIGAAALLILMLCWSAKSDLIAPWLYRLFAAGAAARCVAFFPFGHDYIKATDVGHADWKYRFLWLASCAMVIGLVTATVQYKYEYIENNIWTLGFLLAMLLSVPGENKFAPSQQTFPPPPDTVRGGAA